LKNPNPTLHYCNKVFWPNLQSFKEYLFHHEKCLPTVLNSGVEFYKILEIGLTEFEVFMQKL
jgi:hypothetical protein